MSVVAIRRQLFRRGGLLHVASEVVVVVVTARNFIDAAADGRFLSEVERCAMDRHNVASRDLRVVKGRVACAPKPHMVLEYIPTPLARQVEVAVLCQAYGSRLVARLCFHFCAQLTIAAECVRDRHIKVARKTCYQNYRWFEFSTTQILNPNTQNKESILP